VIRRVNGAGGFAAVLRHGAEEAGAIFFVVPGRSGGASALYGQAPQAMFADHDKPALGGRLFECLAKDLDEADLQARFDREARMDPDFWVVEIELFDGDVTQYFDVDS
jgi:hypothetical protein